MGVSSSGASLGALLHPLMLNHVIHGPLGFANGVRVSAGLVGGAWLVGGLLTRTRGRPRKDDGRAIGLWGSGEEVFEG